MKSKEEILASYERGSSAQRVVITGVDMPITALLDLALKLLAVLLILAVILAIPIAVIAAIARNL